MPLRADVVAAGLFVVVVIASPGMTKFHWVMDNLNTHWTFELYQYLGKSIRAAHTR